MSIKQVSVFLENKVGRAAEVIRIISKEKIDIKALALSDATDFGVLRIIVDDPDRCIKILKENNLVAQETEVIAIEIEDKPGGLNHVLTVLTENGINVEYMYATIEKKKNNAIVIFKIDEIEKAKEILANDKIPMATINDILKNLSDN